MTAGTVWGLVRSMRRPRGITGDQFAIAFWELWHAGAPTDASTVGSTALSLWPPQPRARYRACWCKR